ncbi:MAG: hypothetical protein P8N76_11320 [Pirellulaceae bacterium]|nr:hypothetical protein [Pirellulaceae bacterium]
MLVSLGVGVPVAVLEYIEVLWLVIVVVALGAFWLIAGAWIRKLSRYEWVMAFGDTL